jgi:hypothetical protein
MLMLWGTGTSLPPVTTIPGVPAVPTDRSEQWALLRSSRRWNCASAPTVGRQSAGSSTQSGPLTSPGPARSAASTIVYA